MMGDCFGANAMDFLELVLAFILFGPIVGAVVMGVVHDGLGHVAREALKLAGYFGMLFIIPGLMTFGFFRMVGFEDTSAAVIVYFASVAAVFYVWTHVVDWLKNW